MAKKWKWRWLFRGRVRLWLCAVVLALMGVAVAESWSTEYRRYFRAGSLSGWVRLDMGVVMADFHLEAPNLRTGTKMTRANRAARAAVPMLPRVGWEGEDSWVRVPMWCVMLAPLGALVVFWYRDWRAAAGGLCVRCRYDLSGLEPDDPCPECGKVGRGWGNVRPRGAEVGS